MACPPYLITTVRPWNLASQGSASISVAALADAPAASPSTWAEKGAWCPSLSAVVTVMSSTPHVGWALIGSRPLCRVSRVLVHVSGGQVGGQDDGGVRARGQV